MLIHFSSICLLKTSIYFYLNVNAVLKKNLYVCIMYQCLFSIKVCFNLKVTVSSNWAFEEWANFGVFLWMVFTMILCSVIVLHLILVFYQFYTYRDHR